MHYEATQKYVSLYAVPPAAWLPVMSMGYDAALADALWIRALLYYGAEVVNRRSATHLLDYSDAILNLDPRFRAVYSWVSTAGVYRATAISVDEARRVVRTLRRGGELFPDDGELAWDIGGTLVYEMPSVLPRGSELDQIREEGMAYIESAAAMGAGPPWLAVSIATRHRRLGRLDRAIRHLEQVYALSSNATLKAELLQEIRALQNASHAQQFADAIAAIERDRLRDFPYLPADLYVLVGADVERRADEVARERFTSTPATAGTLADDEP